MIQKALIVRLQDRMCFPVDRITGRPKHYSVFDAYCFIEPDPNNEYISYDEWLKLYNQPRMEE